MNLVLCLLLGALFGHLVSRAFLHDKFAAARAEFEEAKRKKAKMDEIVSRHEKRDAEIRDKPAQ